MTDAEKNRIWDPYNEALACHRSRMSVLREQIEQNNELMAELADENDRVRNLLARLQRMEAALAAWTERIHLSIHRTSRPDPQQLLRTVEREKSSS